MSAPSHLLVIEDDISIGDSLKEVLENEGYSVSIARNGTTGLEIAQRLKPALIILDLFMPIMSGEEFLSQRACREELITLPVIVLTASNLSQNLKSRLGSDVTLMKKPIELDLLVNTIDRLLFH